MINSPSPSSPPTPPNAELPKFSSESTSNIHAAPLPPQPPAKGDGKRVLLIVFILLFIAAVGGGLFAYQNLNKTQTEDLTQVQPTLAWRPTVTGTCTGGTIVRENESVPFLINLDLKLNGTETAPKQAFLSQAPGNSINKTFNWNFSRPVEKGDKIAWTATVKYTQNGNMHEEKYTGTIDITADCATGSPSPSPSASPSSSPSASPSHTPSPSPTVTASPSPTVTATPSPSPTSTPPVGGPSNTPTPTPTPTPAPTTTATPTPTPVAAASSTTEPDNRAVADATALPESGINVGQMFAILGAVSLAISGVFALMKKKYY